MTETVRNLFMSAQTQSHVSQVIWQFANTAFLAAFRNQNLTQEVYSEVKLALSEANGKDITEVSKFFRRRFQFSEDGYLENTGPILYIMRVVAKNDTALLNKSSGLTHKNVQTLYDRLRELDALIQNLKYYRNYFSHNFNDIDDYGWNCSVLSSVIRLCEIALVGKEDHNKNQKIMSSFSNALEKISIKDSKISIDQAVLESKSDTTKINYVIDEIKSSHNAILQRLDEISISNSRNYIPKELHKNSEGAQKSPAIDPNSTIFYAEEQSNLEEDDPDTEFSEQSNLSPEILRQELSSISQKIKEEFENEPGFGASTNLLQIANIGAIFEHEPKTFRDFVAIEIVKSRIDFDLPIIKAQIEKHQNQIDELLSSVLWLSAFEV